MHAARILLGSLKKSEISLGEICLAHPSAIISSIGGMRKAPGRSRALLLVVDFKAQ